MLTIDEIRDITQLYVNNNPLMAFQNMRMNTIIVSILDNMDALVVGAGGEPTIAAGTTAQYWRGDKTWQTLNAAAVGLGNVPNINATIATNLSSGTIPAARYGTATIPISAINATGTPSASTILYGDGTWGAAGSTVVADGIYGDITVSGSGLIWTVNTGGLALGQFPDIATNRVLGRVLPGTGPVAELTGADITQFLTVFTSGLNGVVPASAGGTSNFLRADGTWAAPTGSGAPSDGDKGDITVSSGGATWTIDLLAVTNGKINDVNVSKLTGITGTPDGTKFLRDDFSWQTAPGGAPADGDKGDITVSSTGTVWTIDALAVTNAKLATGIDAIKIADGSVSNTEFQFISTVTSNVQTQINAKQDTLVSGTNIKTINGVTILGSGNLVVPGALTDGDKGDITVSASGATWTIDALAVTNAKINDVAFGKISGITGTPNGSKFLRDDGSWQAVAGGGVADGDKGDVTVSGSGVTWTIDASAVTYAKIQNVTPARILGRYTASAGQIQEIFFGSGLNLNASTGELTVTAGTVVSVTGTTNRITSTGGISPVIDIASSYVGQSSITTLGTITVGVWNGTSIVDANLASLNWTKLFNTPTTVAGYAISDAVTLATSQTLTNKSLTSPNLTGIPIAPTAAPGTNTTQLATTAFVTAAVSAATTGVASFNGRTGTVVSITNDYTWAQIDKGTSSFADITTRSAGDISTGTLNDLRLSSNVPLKNVVNTFTADQIVPDEPYGVSWNGSFEVPTKNALWDKIETIIVGGGVTYTFQHSLSETAGIVNLLGDVASPGLVKYYGTNVSGTRGFYDAFRPTDALIPSRLEFVITSAGATFQHDDLIGAQIMMFSVEGYQVGFTVRSTAVYMAFNPDTGTITLTNGLFVVGDFLIALYRTVPAYMVDGSGVYMRDSGGNLIITN